MLASAEYNQRMQVSCQCRDAITPPPLWPTSAPLRGCCARGGWVGVSLGSSSVTTDANGGYSAQELYKAFGESRYTYGTLGTDYKFTGQRSEAALGIYWFQSRWYDGALGRFIQADSIVPGGVQGLDRYAYVGNSPVRYSDPSGHKACDEFDNNGKCIQWTADYTLSELGLDSTTQRPEWEKWILIDLYLGGGPEGRHAVKYIIENDTRILFKPLSDAGAAWGIDGNIYLDSASYSRKTRDDPYMLSLVAHEAKHLEQGPLYALTVAGELEAWQLQARVHYSLSGAYPYGWNIDKLFSYTTLDAWTPTITLEIRQMFKDFSGGDYRSELLFPWFPSEIYFMEIVYLCVNNPTWCPPPAPITPPGQYPPLSQWGLPAFP